MCGCSSHQAEKGGKAHGTSSAVTIKVADMTCGHCASTITKAIEAALPGTLVDANPVSKLVSVHGSSDPDAIRAVVVQAGYTPSEVTLG